MYGGFETRMSYFVELKKFKPTIPSSSNLAIEKETLSVSPRISEFNLARETAI
jgi:hypothetical protein